MKYFFSLFIITLLSVTLNAQKIDLRLNLEEGETYELNIESESFIVQNLNGQQVNMTMGILGKLSFLVNSATELYEVEVRYKTLQMDMKMPTGQSVSFSSEKDDPQDIFSMMFKKIINQPFILKISPAGKILEVRNIDALFENMFSDFSELSPAQKSQIKDQLRQAYGEEAFKTNFEMATAIFPDIPVGLNDQWKISSKLKSTMTMDIDATYELVEIGDGFYKIDGLADIVTADKEAVVISSGLPMTYDLSGIIVSEIKLDQKSGWIIEAKVKQEITGSASVKENEQLPNGLEIPMNIKNEILYTEGNN